MLEPIVECIANYSEARRPANVQAIADSISAISGVRILDQHSDQDHNRTVITFAGSPAAVEEAAFRSIAKAAELINLDEHKGEHPRIGATDVVPFVPISGITLQDCVAIAQRLGQRVAAELSIPVYLYEEAATRPERQNLENIRRGQYEGLKEAVHTDPERTPDYGPARLGTAGATVIGARQPLIAYNVYLNTDDLEIAKQIARAVRYSSGGLRYVKALGMLVDGRAQVSVNLTNYRGTPVARVVEMIRQEATRYGVVIHHSELVGLIPQEALVDAARWYLQLDQFEPDQILETRLAAIPKTNDASVGNVDQSFLNALASGIATPGGGSAAAYSGAAAAALVAMVARLTIGKKKYLSVESQMKVIIDKAEELRASLTRAVQEDATAYEHVMAAFKLPKETAEEQLERQSAINQATLGAMLVPLEGARQVIRVFELALEVVSHGNINAISDGGTAYCLARAALCSMGMNVRINAHALNESSAVAAALEELASLEARALILENEVRVTLQERGTLSQVF